MKTGTASIEVKSKPRKAILIDVIMFVFASVLFGLMLSFAILGGF